MVIAVDFDGTIVQDMFPEVGAVLPGAAKTLRRLHEAGHTIIIWTCRRDERLKEAICCLMREEIPYSRVNSNADEVVKAYGGDTRKICADMYIDDKNFGGVDWEAIYRHFFTD